MELQDAFIWPIHFLKPVVVKCFILLKQDIPLSGVIIPNV